MPTAASISSPVPNSSICVATHLVYPFCVAGVWVGHPPTRPPGVSWSGRVTAPMRSMWRAWRRSRRGRPRPAAGCGSGEGTRSTGRPARHRCWPFGEHPFGLLDHDPALQRVLEFVVDHLCGQVAPGSARWRWWPRRRRPGWARRSASLSVPVLRPKRLKAPIVVPRRRIGYARGPQRSPREPAFEGAKRWPAPVGHRQVRRPSPAPGCEVVEQGPSRHLKPEEPRTRMASFDDAITQLPLRGIRTRSPCCCHLEYLDASISSRWSRARRRRNRRPASPPAPPTSGPAMTLWA